MSHSQKMGLVMTGGGARGAYQAGVIKRIGEIERLKGRPSPFKIIAGASAGAVNGSFLACNSGEFDLGAQSLAQLWGTLEIPNVFRSDLASLGPRAGQWLRDLSLGGILGGGHAQSLLDFSPLRQHLASKMDFSQIQSHIQSGYLYAVAIAATNYASGKAYIFIQGQAGHPIWKKSRRIAIAEHITVDHVCASAAIPVLFQSVAVQTALGVGHFGDGCLRLTTPLSPAIRLGAERVLAIGVRAKKADAATLQSEKDEGRLGEAISEAPPLSQILGVILNAIFLDHLDSDVEHLFRLNDLIRKSGQNVLTTGVKNESIKIVHPLSIMPSEDIGQIAQQFATKLPRVLRYLMSGLGSDPRTSADLMSYLLFDPDFTSALIDIGYKDADGRIDEIEEFLFGEL